MSTLDRRDALKVVLGGIGGIAIAKTLPGKLTNSVLAESAGKQLGTVQVMNNFPTAGRYEFNSQPIFKVSKGGKSEVIVCQGKMVIQTQKPFLNRDKKQQVNVEVLEWKAVGTSELLGGPVVLTMTKGNAKKTSHVVASNTKDFPANAQFSVSYEMKTSSETISGLTGVIKGVIRALPPLPADVMSMDKLELDGSTIVSSNGGVSVEPVAWAC
jgi:hypothetical protein